MSIPQNSLSADLFEDMGRKVAAASQHNGISDGESKLVEEIESLCMNCHKDGMTKLLLTKIPFFREIVIMSFDCPHCNFKNSEIQPAGEIQQRGVKFSFNLESINDLNRQIIKSDTCVLRIEDIDLEIPSGRGQLTNVEGIITMVQGDLREKQDERKTVMPDIYAKIENIIESLGQMASGGKFPLKITVDDPAGNSWIEPSIEDKGRKYTRSDYARTAVQNAALGLSNADAAPTTEIRPEYQATDMYPQMPAEANVNNVDSDEIVENQVYTFPAACPGCAKPCNTNMKMVNIPHFKQVVLMSTVCDLCGYRSNEVKTGGEIPEKGRRITLTVKNMEDLTRDILKSESCAMSCPEINLSVEPGTLGGRFTTIEGLLTQVRDDLRASIFDLETSSDSMDLGTKEKWEAFFEMLSAALKGEVEFKVVLEDPLASSYVQSFTAPDPDSQMLIEEYERTEEEEESLGLRDMNTENYQEDAKAVS